MILYKAGKFFQASVAQIAFKFVQILHERLLNQAKAHHTLCNMLHATNCNKAVTKLKQSCNTLVTALLQFVACNMLHSVWWA